jgi:pimeloyl-ACP methyl ester carboxylesterase
VNPSEYYARFQMPILVLLGERDNRILVDKNKASYEAARDASGNQVFDIWVIPNATHGLLEVPATTDGQPGSFDRYVPDFHNEMVEWAVKRFVER